MRRTKLSALPALLALLAALAACGDGSADEEREAGQFTDPVADPANVPQHPDEDRPDFSGGPEPTVPSTDTTATPPSY